MISSHTEETKKLLSIAKTGKRRSKEANDSISKGRMGLKRSLDFKLKLAALNSDHFYFVNNRRYNSYREYVHFNTSPNFISRYQFSVADTESEYYIKEKEGAKRIIKKTWNTPYGVYSSFTKFMQDNQSYKDHSRYYMNRYFFNNPDELKWFHS